MAGKLVLCLTGTIAMLLAGGCSVMQSRGMMANAEGRERGIGLRDAPAEAAGAKAAPDARAGEGGDAAMFSVLSPRKIIYTGKLTIVVGDVGVSVKAAKALAEKAGGYVQRMTGDTAVIRVPSAKFDEVLAALEAMGPVTHKDIQARDVTDKYVDLDIRLKNAKAMLAKLSQLLAKANTTKDALAVEREMARVRERIELLEGQVNSLANRVTYATLSIRFTPMRRAPGAIKANLPFWWLRQLGLESLLSF